MAGHKKSNRGAAVGIFVTVLLIFIAAAGVLITRYYPVQYLDIINEYSDMYDLEPAFVCAVINAESRFRKDAVSGAGASGLMQIMEDTAYWIAPSAGLNDFNYEQIFEPEINIRLGCYYLDMYRRRFGTLENALCAYNAGGGRLEQWLSNPEYSSDGKTLDTIPYAETHSYVERVGNYTRVYEILLKLYN